MNNTPTILQTASNILMHLDGDSTITQLDGDVITDGHVITEYRYSPKPIYPIHPSGIPATYCGAFFTKTKACGHETRIPHPSLHVDIHESLHPNFPKSSFPPTSHM